MCNTGNKLMIWQLQNAKSNFPKLCKVYPQQKIFIYTFSRNLYFNSSFKYCFQKALLVKVINTKNYTTWT